MYALDCVRGTVPLARGCGPVASVDRTARVGSILEEHGMRSHLRLPALAFVAILVIGACSSGSATSAPSGGDPIVRGAGGQQSRARRAPRRPRPPRPRHPPRSRRPTAPRAPTRTPCRCGSARAATRAWSTSSSAPGMPPTRQADQPELHRPHGDGGQDRPGDRLGRRAGPDGHGPDLRPAVRERRPAGRHHGPDEGLAGARRRRARATRPSRPSTTACSASRCTPTSRPCSTTRTSSRRPGSTRTSRRPASPRSARTPTRSRRSAATPRATTCRATAPAATSSPSAR